MTEPDNVVRIRVGLTSSVRGVDKSSPVERSLRARIAAHEKWAQVADRSAATQAARQAFAERFELEVDPTGQLPPLERARRAENARSAYFSRLALASVQARRRRARGPWSAQMVEKGT